MTLLPTRRQRTVVLGALLSAGACQVYGSDLVDSSETLVSRGGTMTRAGAAGASSANTGNGANDCRDCSQAGAGASSDDVVGAGGMDEGGSSTGGASIGGGSAGAPLGSGGTTSGGTTSGGTTSGGTTSGGTTSGGTTSGGTTSGGTASGGASGSGGNAGGASTPTCAGKLVSGHCLYLGELGASCDQTCAQHGGFAKETLSFLGTPAQGGTLRNCTEALSAFGVTTPVIQFARTDNRGIGCLLYGVVPYWLTSPAFSASAQHAPTRIVCGCSK